MVLLRVNTDKSAMVFNKNTPANIREEIKALWTNETVQNYKKYLGLPWMVGRSKGMAFSNIKQRVWQRKNYIAGGKEVLLKAVALAIPIYVMSCFKLHSNLCSKLESLMARF